MTRNTSHYKQSQLLALLLTHFDMKEIANQLLLTENQVQRAACAIYRRAKVSGRVEFMAREIARLKEGRNPA